ncbi:MAG: serine--tRNA ligase [Myxococcota bacterium]|nr:serine--tRNA ligase [Myxococcales bacterium]
MLDPRSLEARRNEIAECIRKRGVTADVDIAIDAQRRVAALTTEVNDANRERNEHQKAGQRKLAPDEREAHNALGRRIKERIAELEAQLREAQGLLDEAARTLPNLLHPDVPEGGEDDFVVLATWGEPTKFDFPPLDHLELGARHDLFDFDGAAKVTGAKFYYLKNAAVLLDLALQRFALDRAIAAGFAPVATPDLARPAILEGIGFNPRGEETQVYSVAGHDLCLVGTAEITLGGLQADRVIDEEELPIKHAGISHCFRTEAGAAGRESKGLYRVHQFTKVELFVTCRPEDSDALHDEMRAIEEGIFRDLEIPYRVIDVASGDLGAPAYRKFDIEAWMPGRGEGGGYGEVTSTSNCTDYQARRLKARFKRKGGKKTELVHTLNGTAVAIARTLIPLLENHQQADGSIRIPAALRPYVGRDVLSPR